MRKYYCNPLNLPYRYQLVKEQDGLCVYREGADPSMVLFHGLYYLFYSMADGFYTSDDLCTWDYHPFRQPMPVTDYAPDVRVMNGYLYFCASRRDENCSYYRTKDPIHGTFEEIKGTFPFWDPNMFQDDDGRIYFYWGCTNTDPIYGTELDPETMAPLTEPKALIYPHEDRLGYERNGEDHVPPKSPEEIPKIARMLMGLLNLEGPFEGLPKKQQEYLLTMAGNAPYIEGAWMTKYKGKYYLQYAITGTEYNVYNDGAYVGNEPLGPFIPAKTNPLSYKPSGFITGAGHGSTMEDKNGGWWHISTMRISKNHNFERRLGLWKAGFDPDGEMFCDQRFGDWPAAVDQKPWEDPEWMLLSYHKPVRVSSGINPQAVTDENIRTWWRADTPERGQWVEVDLGKKARICGIQINFADDPESMIGETDVKSDQLKPFSRVIEHRQMFTRWHLEGSEDGQTWMMICDKSKADTDLPHDLVICEGEMNFRYVRLTIDQVPYHVRPSISGLRIFGKGGGPAPGSVDQVSVDFTGPLDMKLAWKGENAVGYVLLWGNHPDKLYHSKMVYGSSQTSVGALMAGAPVYIRIDAFNEAGVTRGSIRQVLK